ncbi:hypothetical protein D3C72_2310520 [compost metagenome]
MAACAGVHRDLPDEKHVGAGRVHISGDKSVDTSSGAFGQDAGVAKVLAQEQVRVEGIQVERRALGNEAVDGGAVFAVGQTHGMGLRADRRRHGT